MSAFQMSRSWRVTAESLPFPLDDINAVNKVFRRWLEDCGDVTTTRILDIWCYCYIVRYFSSKIASGSLHSAADYDMLVTRAYRDTLRNRKKVRHADRFGSWVSVVCKNRFLSYLRSRKERLSLERLSSDLPTLGRSQSAPGDDEKIYQVIEGAIGRLPEFLQKAAHLRILQGLRYEQISDRTGHPIPTIRTYCNKATRLLRTDPEVQLLAREFAVSLDPDS